MGLGVAPSVQSLHVDVGPRGLLALLHVFSFVVKRKLVLPPVRPRMASPIAPEVRMLERGKRKKWRKEERHRGRGRAEEEGDQEGGMEAGEPDSLPAVGATSLFA